MHDDTLPSAEAQAYESHQTSEGTATETFAQSLNETFAPPPGEGTPTGTDSESFQTYLKQEREAAGLPEPLSDDEDEDDSEPAAHEPLSFDPDTLAGGDGSEGDGYAPPVRPAFLDRLDGPEKAAAEALFNGMAKLHREQATYTAYRAAVADPSTAPSVLRDQIEAVAERHGVSAAELLSQYVAPDLLGQAAFDSELDELDESDPFDSESYDPESYDSGSYDEDELDPYGEEPEADVTPEVYAALKELGLDPDELRARQEQVEFYAQAQAIEGARQEWISTQGHALSQKIAGHPDGFRVTAQEVAEARERAYLAGDREALEDPLLAVQRMFPQRYAEAFASRRARPNRAPSLSSSSGTGPVESGGFDYDAFRKYRKSQGQA